jgi:2-oxoglutarate ferredoxin oxidoreductase subunit delta
MAKIKVDPEKCKGCNFCVNVCSFKVISPSGKMNKKGLEYVAVVSADNCKGCGLCAMMCPDCCIELTED